MHFAKSTVQYSNQALSSCQTVQVCDYTATVNVKPEMYVHVGSDHSQVCTVPAVFFQDPCHHRGYHAIGSGQGMTTSSLHPAAIHTMFTDCKYFQHEK